MSCSKEIFAGHSSFAKISSYIGLGKDVTFYLKYFSRHEVYSIIKNNLPISKKIGLHRCQIAFSNYFLFRLEHAINDFKNPDILYRFLKSSLSYDETNLLYKIGIIVCLIKMKKYDNARDIGCQIDRNMFINSYKKSFFSKIMDINLVKNIIERGA